MGEEQTRLVKEAVHKSSLWSRQGVLERLFSAWFSGFVYNQIWEDPAVDLQALRPTGASRILTIASGGCNVLNYLTAGPGQVTAVDLNPHHVQLARLKLLAAQRMPDYETFYNFFGQANRPENLDAYHAWLRPHLDEQARAYWEKKRIPAGRRIEWFVTGLYNQSRLGSFLRLLHAMCKVMGSDTKNMLASRSIAEQERIFQRDLAGFFDHPMVKRLSKFSFSVYSLGIPPQQYRAMRDEHGPEQGGPADMVEDFKIRVHRLLCQFPLSENYFAWQALSRSYDHSGRSARPPYLEPENFAALQANAERGQVLHTSLDGFLLEQEPASLDCFVLLDSQDWMTPDDLNKLWIQIDRAGKPGARIIFRTAGAASPLESALQPGVMSRFKYKPLVSARLFKEDRSAIYGGFHAYEKKR